MFNADHVLYFQLLMEFNILYKVDIVEKMQAGLLKLCTIVLQHGKESEVALVAQSSERKFLHIDCMRLKFHSDRIFKGCFLL